MKWYHLAFTFDGAAGRFYVNGVQETSAGGIAGYYANPIHDGQIGAGDNVVFRVEGSRAVLARTADFLTLAGSIKVPASRRNAAWDDVVRKTRAARADGRR